MKNSIPEDLEIGDIWREAIAVGGSWGDRTELVVRKLVQERAHRHAHKCVFCLTPEKHLEEALAEFGIALWEWNKGNAGLLPLQLEEREAG